MREIDHQGPPQNEKSGSPLAVCSREVVASSRPHTHRTYGSVATPSRAGKRRRGRRQLRNGVPNETITSTTKLEQLAVPTVIPRRERKVTVVVVVLCGRGEKWVIFGFVDLLRGRVGAGFFLRLKDLGRTAPVKVTACVDYSSGRWHNVAKPNQIGP